MINSFSDISIGGVASLLFFFLHICVTRSSSLINPRGAPWRTGATPLAGSARAPHTSPQPRSYFFFFLFLRSCGGGRLLTRAFPEADTKGRFPKQAFSAPRHVAKVAKAIFLPQLLSLPRTPPQLPPGGILRLNSLRWHRCAFSPLPQHPADWSPTHSYLVRSSRRRPVPSESRTRLGRWPLLPPPPCLGSPPRATCAEHSRLFSPFIRILCFTQIFF